MVAFGVRAGETYVLFLIDGVVEELIGYGRQRDSCLVDAGIAEHGVEGG